jgi:hypothetical protein
MVGWFSWRVQKMNAYLVKLDLLLLLLRLLRNEWQTRIVATTRRDDSSCFVSIGSSMVVSGDLEINHFGPLMMGRETSFRKDLILLPPSRIS